MQYLLLQMLISLNCLIPKTKQDAVETQRLLYVLILICF